MEVQPMINYKDVTLKARVSNVGQMEVRLMDLGAIYLGEDHQHDFYFTCSKGKLKFRKGTLGTLITHYERIVLDNAEKTHVYRYDINPSEEEVQQLYAMHEIIGATQKIRKIFQLENITIHLDDLPSGEKFIEVEAKDYAEILSEEQLNLQCQKLFEDLQIANVERLETGYL
jgi:predicted adenylyl cyclase CyaB